MQETDNKQKKIQNLIFFFLIYKTKVVQRAKCFFSFQQNDPLITISTSSSLPLPHKLGTGGNESFENSITMMVIDTCAIYMFM